MPKLTADDLPYRRCVGVMVLNSEGKVWVGERISPPNSEYSNEPKLWQMPQGGIDKGEDPLPAAWRELYEETGIESVDLIAEAPDWISYDLPDHLIGIGLKGKFRGQKQRWFAFRFTGSESEIRISPPPDGHPAEFQDWQWVDMDQLPDLIVSFKRQTYQDVVAVFRHLVE
ncbi:MAG: RNA pyrophosphohydrolase [Pseudomonadota bacterium]